MRQRQACCWWQIGERGDEFADEPSGTSAGAWWRGQGLGGASNLELQPPHTTTQPPNPPPRDPPVEQSPPSSAHLITLLPIEKEEKIERELTLQSFKMNEMAEWDYLSFDSSVISWSNSFNPFTSPCTIGTPTLDPTFIRDRQHAEALKEEGDLLRFSFVKSAANKEQ